MLRVLTSWAFALMSWRTNVSSNVRGSAANWKKKWVLCRHSTALYWLLLRCHHCFNASSQQNWQGSQSHIVLYFSVFFVSYHTCEHDLFQTDELISVRVTTCLENLEMSRNLTAVREMSGILLKIREMSGKSCLKLFIVNCIFVSIQVFSRSLFCLKC